MVDVARSLHADSLTFHNLIFLDRETLQQQKQYDDLLGNSSKSWEGFVFDPNQIDFDPNTGEMDSTHTTICTIP